MFVERCKVFALSMIYSYLRTFSSIFFISFFDTEVQTLNMIGFVVHFFLIVVMVFIPHQRYLHTVWNYYFYIFSKIIHRCGSVSNYLILNIFPNLLNNIMPAAPFFLFLKKIVFYSNYRFPGVKSKLLKFTLFISAF